jgi:hypothetical protein
VPKVLAALSMFGFAVNDILDYNKDRVAGIQRPVATGELSRISATLLASAMLLVPGLFSVLAGPRKATLAITSVLLLVYSPINQRFPPFKDLYVAGLCCAPLYYGVLVGGLHCSWCSWAVLAAEVFAGRWPRLVWVWREWRIGSVRVINHGFYVGARALLSCWIAESLGGAAGRAPILLAEFTAVVGAALWAQYIEGSPQLLRPFGFYPNSIQI